MSRSEAEPEADLSAGTVYPPDLTSVTAHPVTRAVAAGPFCPDGAAVLLDDVDEAGDGVGLAQLLGVEVFPDRVGQVRGRFPRSQKRGRR